jgi:transcriptional regulator with XRE-family HTH domain
MSDTRTDYRAFEASSTENRRLLRTEELILEVTEALVAAMAQQKLTKAQLASRLGKSPAFVTQILNGGRNLTLRTIAEVADALGADIHFDVIPQMSRAASNSSAMHAQVIHVDFSKNEIWATVDRDLQGTMVCEEIASYGAAVAG